MKGFPKYGDTEGLHRNNEVMECAVVVTEKLHGSNHRLMWSPENGGLVLGSRNQIIYKDGNSCHDGFGFHTFLKDHPAILALSRRSGYHNLVFYGEFHGGNIQKGVKYKDEKDFRVFAIRDPEENYMDWDLIETICEEVGFKTVTVLLRGRVELADLEKIIDQNSQTAIENGIEKEENTHEGVVITPLKMRRDRRGNWLRAKYKSQKFAENAKQPKVKKVSPEKAALQEAAREFSECVCTEGRMFTIIEHITREGDAEIHIERTGEFLREFVNDVRKEHDDVYKELDKKQAQTYNKIVSQYASRLWQDHLRKM